MNFVIGKSSKIRSRRTVRKLLFSDGFEFNIYNNKNRSKREEIVDEPKLNEHSAFS